MNANPNLTIKPWRKALIGVLTAALVIFILFRIYYALTDDFRLSNITFPLPYETNWTIPTPTPQQEQEIDHILNQPFHYLGKGAQSYAFSSEDDLYVIKFFKFKHLHPSFFINLLPPIGPLKTYKEKQTARKERKLFGVFYSYRLAFDVDRDESGLIFIQLNTDYNPTREVTLIDKIGIKRTINLANVPFILQYKGLPLRDILKQLLKKGDVDFAEKRIKQILDLYASEYRKGIYDHDHGVMRNVGFVGDKPIHLDVGKLLREETMRDPKVAQKDLDLVIEKINIWVKENFPQYAEHISDYIARQKVIA